MKVFLDDVRQLEDQFWNIDETEWVTARTVDEAIRHLETGEVEIISLDHDLGEFNPETGYDVAKWIEEKVATSDFIPPTIWVHSMNPVGRRNIIQVIESIKRLMTERG